MAKRRKRGDGSIHLRKDGRWEGRIVVGRDAKGLPVTKNVLAKTKAECVAKPDSDMSPLYWTKPVRMVHITVGEGFVFIK